MRKRATFTIDSDILDRIEQTKNGRSASERVNTLLRLGLATEEDKEIAREAKRFFAKPDPDERAERAALFELTKQSWARDEE
jgi:hypothetical protein